MNFSIAFVLSLMGCFITLPLFFRYALFNDLSGTAKLLIFLFLIFVSFAPVIGSYRYYETYGKYFSLIQHTCHFLFISAFILLSFTLIRDFIWLVLRWTTNWMPSPFNMKVVNPVNLITLSIALLCSSFALYEGLKVPSIKEISLSSPKIDQNKKIALLTDLHISRTTNPSKIKGIVDKVNAINPDVVLLAGDIIDDDEKYLQSSLTELSKLKAKSGVFFASGNHEFYIGYKKSLDLIEELGFTVLDNQTQQIDGDFSVSGIPDIRTAKRLNIPVKAFEIDTKKYNVLISHSPFRIDMPFDLMVSGHTHGGQIFPFHILNWVFNDFLLSGIYKMNNQGILYISNGSGQWGPQMRFLAPSEITVIDITKQH